MLGLKASASGPSQTASRCVYTLLVSHACICMQPSSLPFLSVPCLPASSFLHCQGSRHIPCKFVWITSCDANSERHKAHLGVTNNHLAYCPGALDYLAARTDKNCIDQPRHSFGFCHHHHVVCCQHSLQYHRNNRFQCLHDGVSNFAIWWDDVVFVVEGNATRCCSFPALGCCITLM